MGKNMNENLSYLILEDKKRSYDIINFWNLFIKSLILI